MAYTAWFTCESQINGTEHWSEDGTKGRKLQKKFRN